MGKQQRSSETKIYNHAGVIFYLSSADVIYSIPENV
jgi:hypothetical protein